MKGSSQNEKVRLWRIPELGEVELMHARYITQTFPRHTHEGFGVGVIEKGALGFYYRGANLIASQGAINLVNPDEVHTGHAETEEGWTYRMFYFSAGLLRNAACEIADRPTKIPFFNAGILYDDYLAGLIHSCHVNMEKPETLILEKQSIFLCMLTQLVLRHADNPPQLKGIGQEYVSIKSVIDFMHECYGENISIKRLAAIAKLSPFHFIRVFQNQIGLTPHAYLLQTRVRKAKEYLAKGRKIADVAYETGFADQSHLTKNFKRLMGFTPGQYSIFIQDH